MISMEPVLKRGYASWDRDVVPEDEYAVRIESVRSAMRDEGLDALIVVNYSLLGVMVDYADMAYLTGLQSGGALLIALEGEPVLVSFGGGRELFFLRTQTWIANVIPGAGKAFDVLRDQLRGRGIAAGAIGTVGTAAMPAGVAARFTQALADYELRSFDARLKRLRAVKRPREVMAVRITQGIVDDAVAAALAVFAAGSDNRAAMVEAERVARARKARDIRVLANMGGADLRPWEGRLEGRHAPLRLWVAAQYQGYWAESAAMSPSPSVSVASQAVLAMQAAAYAGAAARDVAAAALAVLPAAAVDSALAYGFGGTIGLSLNEGVTIRPQSTDELVDGMLLSLRTYVGGGPEPSFDSAIVSVRARGATRLAPLRIG